MKNRTIQKVTWQTVRQQVKCLYPQLANEIDQLSPDQHFPFYKIRYTFGDEILKSGQFQIPSEEGLLTPLKNNTLAETTRQDLNYNFFSNPVSLVLEGSLELFIDVDDRIIPYRLLQPGHLFGLWKILDNEISHCPPVFCWGLTAGARSLFMLPKISDALCHQRLRKTVGIHSPKPDKLKNEWHVFREIYHSTHNNQPWHAEILCFSSAWFQHWQEAHWQGLKNLFLQEAWESSQFWRNQYVWNLTFTRIQTNKRISPSPFIDHFVRHLFTVAVGALPGFAPALDDQWGPIAYLEKIYAEIYQLRHYQPIFMHPHAFLSHEKNTRSVYLSMQYPSALEMPPRQTHRLSALEDLTAIYHLLQAYQDQLSAEHLKICTTPLSKLSENAKFNFYHSLETARTFIRNSQTLPSINADFSQQKPLFSQRAFPTDSSFFRGCIEIRLP